MNKINYAISLLLFTIILLGSCSNPIPTQKVQHIETGFISTPTPILSPEPTFYIGPTAIPNPTDVALYFSPDQITDGTLRLTIQEVESVCHNRKDSIAIRMTFKNLTFHPIDIVAVHGYHYGVMAEPVLTQADRNIYHCPDCPSIGFPYFPPIKVESLPILGVVKIVIQYRIFGFRAEVDRGNYVFATPEPGIYFLKFVYKNRVEYPEGVWTGKIASNQIQICIAE